MTWRIAASALIASIVALVALAAPINAARGQDDANADGGYANDADNAPRDTAAPVAAPPAPGAATDQGPETRLTLVSIDWAQGAMQARLAGDAQPRTLTLTAPDLASLAQARAGDQIDASTDQRSAPTAVVAIAHVWRPVGLWGRILALAASLGALLLAACLATNWRPQLFLIGVDNRYSNSQCQLAAWFSVLAVSYAATFLLRVLCLGGGYIGLVNATPNLIALSGLSALSFGGAKAITIGKVNAAAEKGVSAKPPRPTSCATSSATTAAAPTSATSR